MACQTCAERRKWIKAKAAAAYRKLTGKAEPVALAEGRQLSQVKPASEASLRPGSTPPAPKCKRPEPPANPPPAGRRQRRAKR